MTRSMLALFLAAAPATALAQDVPPAPEATAASTAPAASAQAAAATPQSEPAIGWGRGRRAPMYVNLMMLGGGMVEDSDNRLTTRDGRTLEGVGGLLRIGAVLSDEHRLGVRLQSFVRPTKKIVRDEPLPAGTNPDWGTANFTFAGPEYIYTLPSGFYGAASTGVGLAFTNNDIDKCHDCGSGKDNLEHGAAGVAGLVSLGYEWRLSKWFAMNVEAHGGVFRGVDDDERSMTTTMFGIGMGAGF
jgi:hypothetical protein